MKKGQKLTAISACPDKFSGHEYLTVGKEYEIISVSVFWFSVKDDHGGMHHFSKDEYEAYFQSITPESLDELGFKRGQLSIHLHLRGETFNISITPDMSSIRVNGDVVPNCKTLTDLKHLIRILGV